MKTCVLCHREFEGHGNNPWPLAPSNEVCCDECNWLVLKARLEVQRQRKAAHEKGRNA